ncbi:MAG: SDR family oxidoreductase [Candidatus Omnitrophica bacterium]|nr:SDR family oxidoreductase [Candidatus Omnitrophota bacterium]
MDLGLKDKVAIISGGTHGIGRAIALTLAQEGCRVAVFSRTQARIDETLALIRAKGGEAMGFQADAMSKDDMDRVVRDVAVKWHAVHILVNNVGGGGRWGKDDVEATDPGVWQEVYDKNTMAAVRLTMSVLPLMRRQKWGRVVTITSIFGREAGGRPWFTMAKAAEGALMKTLAKKASLAQEGITFNSVAPGAIMIPHTGWEKSAQDNPKETEDFIKRELPLGRFGTPEEVASVVAFICSTQAALLSGASIPVDGGQSNSLF